MRVDEEDAVEVVDLVLQGSCEKFVAFDFEGFAGGVLGANFDRGGAENFFADIGQAEAALFFDLLAVGFDDDGVDQCEFVGGIFAEA